jgi:hypothetical protein
MDYDKRISSGAVASQVFEHSDDGVISPAPGRHWQQSLPSRISAIGFIILIIMGNLWLIEALLGGRGQVWVRIGLQMGTVTVLVGAVSLLLRAIIVIFR